MKLYLIARTDGHGYDEYDSILVRAESKVDALKFLANDPEEDSWQSRDKSWRYSGFKSDGSNATIVRVKDDGERACIIGSFNAG